MVSSYLWKRREGMTQDWKKTSKVKEEIIPEVALILGAEGRHQTGLKVARTLRRGDVGGTVPVYGG